MVDCGFSFTHAVPVFQNCAVNYGAKRIDLGGKALTNYLKELVSYRAVNVIDKAFIMDDIKEKLCFVSLDVERDHQISRLNTGKQQAICSAILKCYTKHGKDNIFRCTDVLLDRVTHTKGYVKDPEAAQRHLTLTDGASPSRAVETKKEADQFEVVDKTGERKRVDLTKNEFDLSNERFLAPEMTFQPADLGMNETGLAECFVRAVNTCHPYLHTVLYQSIILTDGSTLFPRFAERLQKDLRPLVPEDYQVKITTQEDPILGVWRGGLLLASSPEFESMCVTKAEYEELGSARYRRRFFH